MTLGCKLCVTSHRRCTVVSGFGQSLHLLQLRLESGLWVLWRCSQAFCQRARARFDQLGARLPDMSDDIFPVKRTV